MPVLLLGAIYSALYWRPDGKYHWVIIVADDRTSGPKLHATNLEHPANWWYAHDDFGLATERKPLVILAQIGVYSHMNLFGNVDRGRRVSTHTTASSPVPTTGKTKSGAGAGSASIDSLLRAIPLETPECDAPHPFTCRVWFREAVRALVAQGAVVCLSVDALEKELTGLADANGDGVALGGPWKLHHDDLDSVRL